MNIWNGIYAGFTSDENAKYGFVNHSWIDRSVERLELLKSGNATPFDQVTTIDTSTLAIALVCASQNNKQLVVLDVGGNLGQTALLLSTQLGNPMIKWVVLEREDFLHACSEKTTLPAGIEFISEIDSINAAPNVIHFGSSLQYFEDWRGATDSAVRPESEWVVLSDIPGNYSIPTFTSHQKYYEDHLNCWFFNVDEIIEQMLNLGFKLLFQRPHITEVTKKYFPETSFPPSHRIEYPIDLLFRRV